MTRFIDGPAEGKTLMLQRAPFFLRAVQSFDGSWDALDQLHDEPRIDERIVLYQLEGEPTWIHVCRSPRSQSGMYRGGTYRLASDPPGEATLRSRVAWQEWANREGPKRSAGVQPGVEA